MTAESWGTAIAAATARLRQAGVEDAAADARLLAIEALGSDRTGLISALRDRPSDRAAGRFRTLVERRTTGVPVSRLRGWREFWSLPLGLSAETLDPRPDTETLVEATLAVLPDRKAPYRLADLGTGSGAILLALLSERPRAWGLGLDLAEGAAIQARVNAVRLGLADRAGFVVGHWTEALRHDARLDAILSNPPYIPSGTLEGLAPEVRDHDPRLALDGGEDGLAAYRAIAATVPVRLRPGGWLIVEVGSGQARAVSALFRQAGLRIEAVLADLAGLDRVVCAQKMVGVDATDG